MIHDRVAPWLLPVGIYISCFLVVCPNCISKMLKISQDAHFVRSHATLGDLSVTCMQDGPVQRTCPVAASSIQSWCLHELHLDFQTMSMEELNLFFLTQKGQ